MKHVFKSFFDKRTLAFHVESVKPEIQRIGIDKLVADFAEWCEAELRSRKGEFIGVKTHTGESRILNYDWKPNNSELNSKIKELRYQVGGGVYNFITQVQNITHAITYVKTGELDGIYLKEEYDFVADSMKLPHVNFDDSFFVFEISQELIELDNQYWENNNPPFKYKITELKKFFCLENAVQMARELS
jgi:hypothetical protein